MDFKDILIQIERPYWSPVHPSKYIRKASRHREGWGLVYPDDIGAFNLMWLMSGVGGPPDSYEQFTPMCEPIIAASYLPLHNRWCVKDAAAMMPINRFYDAVAVKAYYYDSLTPILDALRLHV